MIKIQITDAINVTNTKTIRRSILSETKPIGHWNRAPNIVKMTINRETCKLSKPFVLAYTAPSPKIVPCAKPINNAPTNPSGDNLYRSVKFNLFGFSKLGGFDDVNKIGMRAKDNSIETKTNKSNLAGSLRFNKKLPIPINENVVII